MAAHQQMALKEEEEAEEFEFHVDVLESIMSHVPLVDLVPASHVSKSWCVAVFSSLRHLNKPRPWLILHRQATCSPYDVTAHAYDPRSQIWIQIPPPPKMYTAGLKSSHSNFIYMLSPLRFSFSSDPLNLEWHHVEPPMVWRPDPIVARVGDSVVIAGGGCDFADDPLAVEIYDLNARVWHYCDSMPGNLRDSAASLSLSIAVVAEKLIVTDRVSGETHWFDPEGKSWTGPFHLCTGEPVSSYNIGCSSKKSLILVGLYTIENVERVKIWNVRGEGFECEEMGEMPSEYVAKLKSRSLGKCSIHVRAVGSIVYVYNDKRDVEEVVACEWVDGGGCRWWSVRNTVVPGERTAAEMVLTCAEVGIEELQRHRVMRTVDGRFGGETAELGPRKLMEIN